MIEIKDKKDDNIKKQAKFRIKELKSFYSHLFTYILFNFFLFIINFITSPDEFWFYWVIFGWGIGIFCHAINVFLLPFIFNSKWENRFIRKYIDRNKD